MKDFLGQLAPLPTPAQMHEWDAMSMRLGLPGVVLMENASRAALDVLQACLPLRGAVVWLFMGKGNNGGDAACLARHLLDAGANPLVLHLGPLGQCRGDTARHVRIARAAGVPFLPLARHNWSDRPDIVVDGLLGTGFSGQLRPGLQQTVERINSLGRNLARGPGKDVFVLALDIPSGLDGNSGLPCPVAVRADVTVSFAAAKPGLVLPHARQFTGRLCVRPIGIPRLVQDEAPCSTWLADARCLAWQKAMPANSHKYSFGHVLVLGGAQGMAGAAHLAARAALRAGAGLVTVAAPEENLGAVRMDWPEIMTTPAGEGQWPGQLPASLQNLLGRASAVVVGPGMGRGDDAAAFLSVLLDFPHRPPTVLDADALVLLGKNPALYARLTAADILTPHPGEAAAMLACATSAIQAERPASLARLCALSRAVVVLKGAGTLLGQGNGPVLLCPYDLPQLAIAGSGDVLAGCIAARLAQAGEGRALQAATLAVVNHALAGMICAGQCPGRGNTASAVADSLPQVPAWLATRPGPDDTMPWPAGLAVAGDCRG